MLKKAKEKEENINSIETSNIHSKKPWYRASDDTDPEINSGEISSNNIQCGVHKKMSEEHRIGNLPWALKIIGKYNTCFHLIKHRVI